MARLQITDRDRRALAFAAEHRFVLAAQAQTLAGASRSAAESRLSGLAGAGLLRRQAVFHRQPPCYQITRVGLGAIGSDLPPPRFDLRCYRHDVGLAWLWLVAHAGVFGRPAEIVSERRMRSHDARVAGDAGPPESLGVRLGGVGPGGRPRLHYPDLLLVQGNGRRIALELELSSKARVRREGILAGYGADPRIDAVLYLTESAATSRAVTTAATRLGLAPLVHVHRIRAIGPPCAPDPHRAPARVRRAATLAR